MSMYYVMAKNLFSKETVKKAIHKARLRVLLYDPSTLRDVVVGGETMSAFAMKATKSRASWELERSRCECLARLDTIEDALDELNWKEREEVLKDIKDLTIGLGLSI